MNRVQSLLMLLMMHSLTAKAQEGKPLEVLSDLDLGFLVSQPKIPWGEDPFHRVPGFAEVAAAAEKFNLTGIFFSKNSPMAVVNGKMVQEGDLLGDRIVKKIGENFVILKKNGSEIEVSMPPIIDAVPDEDPNAPEGDGEESL